MISTGIRWSDYANRVLYGTRLETGTPVHLDLNPFIPSFADDLARRALAGEEIRVVPRTLEN